MEELDHMAHNGASPDDALGSLQLLYDIGRELAGALDLRDVLHRVLFLSMKNVGAISGSIIVLDEFCQPLETAFLMSSQEHDDTALQLRVTYERGLAGWVAKNNQSVLIFDTSKDERWLRRPDDAEDKTGSKSAISAPVLARDTLVGVITLVHPNPGYFNKDHLDLVNAIADQAGLAILNARLYADSQRQARLMTAVAESVAAINASLDLDVVLNRILEQISQALEVEGTWLALIDRQDGDLEIKATTLEPKESLIGLRIPSGEGIAGWVAIHGDSVMLPDVINDERYSPEFSRHLGIKRSKVLCVPICSEDQVIGVLEVDNPKSEAYTGDNLRMLSGIGEIAGTAIRHAQLYELQQASHRRYRELFEDSIYPIFITDWEALVVEANRQAEIILKTKHEKLISVALDKLHQLDLDVLGEKFSNLTADSTLTYESTLHLGSGREIPIEVYLRVVQYEGEPYLQWMWRDISERKNLEKMREDLIAMVYHDLRSPLANVVSSLGIMDTVISDNEELETLFAIAMRSTKRIQRLTDSLLDINKLEAGLPVGNRRVVAPETLLSFALDAVESMAKSKSIEIIIKKSEGLPGLNVDEDMIQRVIINLLENAIKFSATQDRIIIGAKYTGETIQFRIEDNGPGIANELKDHIFDKFTHYQVTNGYRGVGLGLAFCKLAVVGHGGRIWVESDTGSGATFRFELPVAS